VGGLELLGVVAQPLLQHHFLQVPGVVIVLQLDLHALVEQIPLLPLPRSQVRHRLLNLPPFLVVPRSQLLSVDIPDLVLDEMGLHETWLEEHYSFCLAIWCSISRRFSSW
jgi:hypothetical protein